MGNMGYTCGLYKSIIAWCSTCDGCARASEIEAPSLCIFIVENTYFPNSTSALYTKNPAF